MSFFLQIRAKFKFKLFSIRNEIQVSHVVGHKLEMLYYVNLQ
jgi:hypothetical protein